MSKEKVKQKLTQHYKQSMICQDSKIRNVLLCPSEKYREATKLTKVVT